MLELGADDLRYETFSPKDCWHGCDARLRRSGKKLPDVAGPTVPAFRMTCWLSTQVRIDFTAWCDARLKNH